MANNNTETLWKTTVIVSTSLQSNEITVLLLAQHHLLRYSDNIEPGTLVFPLSGGRKMWRIQRKTSEEHVKRLTEPSSGVAFLSITPDEFPEKAECEEFLKRIEKFIHVHRNSFLLFQAPAYGAKELKIVSTVQDRFFGSNLKVLPVHSNADAVKGMLIIAKATSRPHMDKVKERMHLAQAHIIEHSLETLLKKVDI